MECFFFFSSCDLCFSRFLFNVLWFFDSFIDVVACLDFVLDCGFSYGGVGGGLWTRRAVDRTGFTLVHVLGNAVAFGFCSSGLRPETERERGQQYVSACRRHFVKRYMCNRFQHSELRECKERVPCGSRVSQRGMLHCLHRHGMSVLSRGERLQQHLPHNVHQLPECSRSLSRRLLCGKLRLRR